MNRSMAHITHRRRSRFIYLAAVMAVLLTLLAPAAGSAQVTDQIANRTLASIAPIRPAAIEEWGPFNIKPRIYGSWTWDHRFYTTGGPPPLYQIRVRPTKTTGGYKIKVVNCTGGEFFWGDGYHHVSVASVPTTLYTLARNVPRGACFKLNFLNDAWGHWIHTDVRISY